MTNTTIVELKAQCEVRRRRIAELTREVEGLELAIRILEEGGESGSGILSLSTPPGGPPHRMIAKSKTKPQRIAEVMYAVKGGQPMHRTEIFKSVLEAGIGLPGQTEGDQMHGLSHYLSTSRAFFEKPTALTNGIWKLTESATTSLSRGHVPGRETEGDAVE